MLPSHKTGIYYIDHCRVMVDDGRILYAKESGGQTLFWNIPDKSTAVVLLGPGSSLTQSAARKLAENGVMVAYTGTGATPLFLASQSEYRPTERFHRWMKFWPDADKRLRAAKELQKLRCDSVENIWPKIFSDLKRRPDPDMPIEDFRDDIRRHRSVDALMGAEGNFARELYRECAGATGVKWIGRDNERGADKDVVNKFLDHGNYLAYGIASFVLWAVGIPSSLPVTHGASRAGGLVFDLADVVKDAIIMPRAFMAAAEDADRQAFRDSAIADLHEHSAIPTLFRAVDVVLDTVGEPAKK